MYAVIETGGKQYRVEQGDVIEVERLGDGGSAKSDKVEFDRVLMVRDDKKITIGDPVVDGAKVTGMALGDYRAPKVVVFKMKRRKTYRRTKGHRQHFTQLRITAIQA